MQIIAHRRNTIEDLLATPAHYGVEVDIRSSANQLIIHHDPMAGGVSFEQWIERYQHKTLILNVKEEGLEDRLLSIMAERDIKDFFFLDQSFPFIVRTVRRGENRCAVRVSEFESVDTALSLAGKARWVWIDCFSRFPLGADELGRLAGAGFKTCVVSPELQGRFDPLEIGAMRAHFAETGFTPTAVCTKTPEFWL